MATESGIADKDMSSPPATNSDFVAQSQGALERRIIQGLCEPILVRLSPRIHPNQISLVTHAIAWFTAACAVGSAYLEQPLRSAALVSAGIGMLLQMVGDCLDGMHARRTQQCSKLGEMMDHWLDASVVPLATVGITVALGMAPWSIVLVNITATMVYQAQLVLYHHTGRFVHPEPANGVEAQFGLAIGYVALGALFYFIDPQAPLMTPILAGVAVVGTIVQLRCSWFYYPRLHGFIAPHVRFVALLAAAGLLYLIGATGLFGFVALLVATSFRISGSYVLFTLIGKPYDGNDRGIVAFLLAIALAWAWPQLGLPAITPASQLLPFLACGYMVARNFLDFARHFAALQRGTNHD